MAGNPFRRTPAPPAQDEPPQRDEAPPSGRTKLTKKKVKIQTPPHSPEIPRRLSAGRASPPPPPTSNDDDSSSDSTATADSELEEALRNTRRNSGSLPPPANPGVTASGAPYNPFARTLATSEAAFGLQRTEDTPKETDGANREGQTRSSGSRPAMDVEQFKNILLTGSAAPSPPVSISLQRVQESGSNTDASSVSRQSLFDPMIEIHPETPRTSFDQIDSPSEDDDDDEGSNLMSNAERLDDLAPPAPPKHTHGKRLAPKGPQTVSFADFDDSFVSSSSQSRTSTPPVSANEGRKKRPPMLHRSASDLNKPLPATPPLSPAAMGALMSSTANPAIAAPQTTSISAVTDGSVDVLSQSKKAPPPPPVSRRAGPASTHQDRPSAATNSTPTPVSPDTASPKPSQDEVPPKIAAPPPPPSRKARPTSQSTTPSFVPTPDLPSPVPSESKTMPPPPPRRTTSKTGNSVHRTNSNGSRTSVQNTDATSTPSHVAPPAPPPRRGQKRESTDGQPKSMTWALNSSRVNGDGRRSSATSLDSQRSTTISNLERVQEPVEIQNEAVSSPVDDAASSRDILADMTAFQAEIDALRAKSQNNG